MLSAVLTNAALVAFTGTFALNETWAARGWVFFSMAGGIILYVCDEYVVFVASCDIMICDLS